MQQRIWSARAKGAAGSPPQALLPHCPRCQVTHTCHNRGSSLLSCSLGVWSQKTNPHLPKESKTGLPGYLCFLTACGCLALGSKVPHNMSGRQMCWCVIQGSGWTVCHRRKDCFVMASSTFTLTSCEQPCGHSLVATKKLMEDIHDILVVCPENLGAPKFASAEQQFHFKVFPPLTGQAFLWQQELLWPHSFLMAECQQCARRKMSFQRQNKKRLPENTDCSLPVS